MSHPVWQHLGVAVLTLRRYKCYRSILVTIHVQADARRIGAAAPVAICEVALEECELLRLDRS